MEEFRATYRIHLPASEARQRAEAILLEQTVETPRRVAEAYPFVRDNVMGRLVDLTPADDGQAFLATLALPVFTAGVDPMQFLNVLFGNSSLHDGVRLDDFHLPASLAGRFHGPSFGIEGLRRAAGVYDRPLTCSALKPVGLSLDETVDLCRAFAEGGVDYVKDDHYLADHPFCPFDDRVEACQETVTRVSQQTGRRTLYVPNLSGTPEQVVRQAERAQALGVAAVMIAPMLVGLPFFFELTRQHLKVPILAHPSFGGTAKIEPGALFGKLLRMYGADAVIFVNYGGRFAYPRARCRHIAEVLRAQWHSFRAAMPVPAGGMQVRNAPELVSFFGNDTMLLIGGSLLEAGAALRERTAAFVDSVRRAADLVAPQGRQDGARR